jgi:hypothetical protein
VVIFLAAALFFVAEFIVVADFQCDGDGDVPALLAVATAYGITQGKQADDVGFSKPGGAKTSRSTVTAFHLQSGSKGNKQWIIQPRGMSGPCAGSLPIDALT